MAFTIHQHGSATVYKCSPSWTHLPPPSPSYPSGSSQYTSPEYPVSCIGLGLVIYVTYDNIHVSIQIILPSPSPTESKCLFFISVSLLLSYIEGHHYHLSKFHIYALVYCIGVFFLAYFTLYNRLQCQGLFKWASSSHQVAIVLEFQLQHQSFQWIFRTDFL